MGILAALIIGAIAGWLAGQVVKGFFGRGVEDIIGAQRIESFDFV